MPSESAGAVAGLAWSVLRDGALPGDLNMARDHALAVSLEPGDAVLRLYRWASPTLSLGRNEPGRHRIDAGAARRAGVGVVRRPTGGRAVLHHRELTYSVVVPVRALGSVRESYVVVNRALRRGLASLGVQADIAPDPAGGRPPGPDAGPCFRAPAPGEVVVGGRKLVGSAQARMGRALLQHGSILLADDQGLIRELTVEDGSAEVDEASPPATLSSLLGEGVPGCDALGDALVRGFREELGGVWRDRPPSLEPGEEGRLRAKYASEEWTWRR